MRGAFYYPWFPETWGTVPVWNPSLGRYDSTLGTFQAHIAMMQYAKCGFGISSWWGPTSPYSLRFDDQLKAAEGTRFKWCLYYESEGYSDPQSNVLAQDLTYAYNRWTSHPNYLRKLGKPVIFAYAGAPDGSAMCDRWKVANGGRFYTVLKVFTGFQRALSQPDSWHEYAPANGIAEFGPWCVSVSPGFAMTGQVARLPRDPDRFRADVKTMVDADPEWQLVTTFNEWGEGTAVEPSLERGTLELDILAGKRPA